MNTWQLEKAKKKLRKVVELAIKQGPQLITDQGEKVAVVISYDEYASSKKSRSKLSEFFRESPLTKVNLDLSRDKSFPREAGKWLIT
jgi:prevent-host-death family protein